MVDYMENCLEQSNGVCIAKPWLGVVQGKIGDVKLLESFIIVVKLPLFHRLLMRIIGIENLGFHRGGVIVGYKGSALSSNEVLIDLSSEDLYRVYSEKLPRILALPLSEPLRVLSFIAIGASGILVNLAVAVFVYNGLKQYLGVLINTVASSMGFEASVFSNFTLNELITFKDTGLERTWVRVAHRLIKYHVASIASFASQVSFANALPLLLGTPFWLGQLMGIIVGFIVNFILGYIYTWSMHRIK
jgi:putative flippase GtrA